MDDENKATNAGDSGKEDLEGLRDLFQKKYDETANGPVIQELDEEKEETPEEPSEKEKPAKKKKAKKKSKLSPKAQKIIDGVVYAILIIALLIMGIYIGYDKSFPEHHDYETAMKQAEYYASLINATATDGEDEEVDTDSAYSSACDAYDEAVEACNGNDSIWAKASKIQAAEAEAKLILENENQQAAYSYLTTTLTTDELDAVTDSTVKDIINIAGKLSTASADVFSKVADAVDAGNADAETIASECGLEDESYDTFLSAVQNFIDGYTQEKTATNATEKAAIYTNYYSTAISNLSNAGADSTAIAENICAVLYQKGYVYSAVYASQNGVGDDPETTTDAYSAMLEELTGAGAAAGNISETAASANGKTGAELYADTADLTDAQKSVLAATADLFIAAYKDVADCNLTSAADNFEGGLEIEEFMGVTDANAMYNYVSVLFKSGSIPAAESYAEENITDDVETAFTDAQKTDYENMQLAFTALDSASSVFSEYYQNYYYYGTAIDYDAVCEDLDATLTSSSNNYDRAFVYYCKYYAALYSDADVDTDALIDGIKQNAPELKALYGYFYLENYVNEADWTNATAAADDILSVNIADDYAISVKALVSRMNKDYDGALRTALTAVDLLGDEASYSTKEAGVDCLLKGDYENAYKYLLSAYNANLSLENCDLLLILNYIYNGDNEEVKEGLAEVAEEISGIYEQYSATSFDSTTAILNGTKTVESVLTSGNGSLS